MNIFISLEMLASRLAFLLDSKPDEPNDEHRPITSLIGILLLTM